MLSGQKSDLKSICLISGSTGFQAISFISKPDWSC